MSRQPGRSTASFLSLHGSMLADGRGRPRRRPTLPRSARWSGDAIPIVATLDLHANVTQRMIDHATALVAYTHYPHDDARTTGERGARLLLQTVAGEVDPVMVMAKVPMLVAGCNGQTFGDAPMHRFEQRARAWEARPARAVGLESACASLSRPTRSRLRRHCHHRWRSSARRRDRTANRARLLGTPARAHAGDLFGRGGSRSVAALVDGPVVLVDTADCCGGGAAGDSIAVLRELLALGVGRDVPISWWSIPSLPRPASPPASTLM